MILPHVGSKAQCLSTCNIKRDWKLLVYEVLIDQHSFRDVRQQQRAIEIKNIEAKTKFLFRQRKFYPQLEIEM